MGDRHRRPRAGERTRGAVDALQTKIAVSVQNLDPHDFSGQLTAAVAELPEACGSDAAFLALVSPDGSRIETIFSARTGFSQCSPAALENESLEDWPWLRSRLGSQRVIEVADTTDAPKNATEEFARLSQLHIGSLLLLGISVHDEIAGFLAIANEHPVENWDANLNLLVRLIGASLSTGLERARDRRVLDELRQRNDLVSITANDGIWDFDGESKNISLSRRWKAMLGYDPDDQDLMLDWYHLVHPDDMARVQAAMRSHLEGKSDFFESTHRMKHQSGDWRWMKSRARAVTDDNGRLLRLLGVEVDITERKLYEDALFREKESAQITLQSIGDGVITTDAECNVEYVNPVASELTGWKVDDASGRSIDEIFRGFHEETWPCRSAAIARSNPCARHCSFAATATNST